jgi:hypothetical protein
MQCDVINRVSVHPSIKIGGVSVGQCPKVVLEGFVVCFEHVNKEALWMMVQHERRDLVKERKANELLRKQIKALQKDVRRPLYKGKKPREALKGLKAATRKLKVSKPVQDILLQIAEELNETWMEQLKVFKHETRRTKR